MPKISISIDTPLKRAAAAVCGAAIVVSTLFICKWTLGNILSRRIDSREVADLAVRLAPDDPQALYGSAIFRAGTFEPEDAAYALRQLETAVSKSPSSYALWLALARSREASGDAGGAELAIRRAVALAPSYSRVRWAMGNILLRRGDTNGAFSELRRAAAADVKYAQPLVTAAVQAHGDDATAVRNAVGASPAAIAALSLFYANAKRHDAAFEAWASLSGDGAVENIETGGQVLAKFLEAKRFTDAQAVANSIGGGKYAVGRIYDGGFENDIKSDSSVAFEWLLGSGAQPQIARTNGQKRSGEYSLLLIFRVTTGNEFRGLSQTVAVVPGRTYKLDAFYRTDIQTAAKLKWQISDAASARVVGETGPTVKTNDWTALSASFTVPADTDGVVVRLAREDCALPGCAVAGNLWIDDVTLTAQ